MRVFKLGTLLGAIAALAMVVGCGSANNDQGVSFLLTGFKDQAGTSGNPLDGAIIHLASNGSEASSVGGSVKIAASLQNDLTGQFIRLQRVYISYVIQGSSVNPPDTNVAISGVAGPGEVGGSTLPPVVANGNKIDAEFLVVPPDISTWINFHKAELPEPPFTMEALVTVRGTTSGGDTLDTNQESFFLNVLPPTSIDPTAGSGSGSSSSSSDQFNGTGGSDSSTSSSF